MQNGITEIPLLKSKATDLWRRYNWIKLPSMIQTIYYLNIILVCIRHFNAFHRSCCNSWWNTGNTRWYIRPRKSANWPLCCLLFSLLTRRFSDRFSTAMVIVWQWLPWSHTTSRRHQLPSTPSTRCQTQRRRLFNPIRIARPVDLTLWWHHRL